MQNGSRSYHNDILEIYKKLKKKVKIDKYFVFNKTFQTELSKFVDTKFSTLGSPLNNNIKKMDYNFINTALYIAPFSLSTFLKFKKDKKKLNEFYHREIEFIKKINFELNKRNIRLSILGKLRDHNKSIEKKIFRNPGLYLGEGYMNQDFIIEEGSLDVFLKIITSSYDDFINNNPAFKTYQNFSSFFKSLHQINRLMQSKKNVEHHYDLNENMYKLFLDKDMQYSCGYFHNKNISLDQAQLDKKKHIIEKIVFRQK